MLNGSLNHRNFNIFQWKVANLPLPVMLTIETTSTESPRIVWLSSSKIQQTKEVKVELLIIEQDATQAEIYDLAFGDDFKILLLIICEVHWRYWNLTTSKLWCRIGK